MTERHWEVVRFLRDDFTTQGATATTRRVNTVGASVVLSGGDAVPQPGASS